VNTGAPPGAEAAVVNITVTGATNAGYVTAEDCAPRSGERTSSNGNATPGITSANLSVVAIDAQGRFCLYESQPMETIVDVQGFFAPAASSAGGGNLLTTIAPQRVMDTRAQTFCLSAGTCGKKGPISANTAMAITTNVVPKTAVAILSNLTVTAPSGAGYLTADACAALANGPQTRSNTNFLPGATVANLAVVPAAAVSAGMQMCTYSNATTHEAIDLQGYFAPASEGGWGFSPQAPQRLLDTREGDGALPGANTIIRIQGPAGQSAALVNLTLVGAKQAGYVTADKCSALTAGPQTKSNSNMTVGLIAANVAVVPLDEDGSFCVYLSQATHLVVDLQGSFSPAGPLRFTAITPVRRHDSRELNTP
jgi:hypothetical protein